MDQTRLDRLARRFATPTSRRIALGLIAALLGADAAPIRAQRGRHHRRRCTAPIHARCDGVTCVALLTDASNCGTCGQACPAGFPICRDGTCCTAEGICECVGSESACNSRTCCLTGPCRHGRCP